MKDYESEASSAASEDSTSDSNEPVTPSNGNANETNGDAVSSVNTGPPLPAITTSRASDSPTHPSISSAEDSPVRTSASQAAEQDSMVAGPASSTNSPASQMSLYDPADGGYSRTFPDYFPATTDAISPSYSRRWPKAGFTTSPGECWTVDISESPNDAAESSSLHDVLEADVPGKYYLSPKAARGIMRRSKKRGRTLPAHLAEALAIVAGHQTTNE